MVERAGEAESAKKTSEEIERELAQAVPTEEFDWDRTEEFFIANWQKFAGAVVVVFLGIWVVQEYRGAQEKRRSEAAQRFSEVQKQYSVAFGTEDKEKTNADSSADSPSQPEELSKNLDVLSENVKALGRDSADSFYGRAAAIYSAAASGERKDLNSGIEMLRAEMASSSQADVLSSEGIAHDMSSLLLARMLLERSEGEDRANAQNILQSLVSRKGVASAEALFVLARIASNDSEKTAVKDLAQQLVTAVPTLRDSIVSPLKEAGIALDNS